MEEWEVLKVVRKVGGKAIVDLYRVKPGTNGDTRYGRNELVLSGDGNEFAGIFCLPTIPTGATFGAPTQKMRTLFVIFLTLTIQSGLFARLVLADISCPFAVMEECHPEDCGGHDKSDFECEPGPDGKKCPLDGHSHHHHHGPCVHLQPLTCFGESGGGAFPPQLVRLERDELQWRVPQGPVADLDKPPLN